MHRANGPAERTFDSAFSKEQVNVDRSSPTDTSKEPSDHSRLNLEVAIEWAHLGGD